MSEHKTDAMRMTHEEVEVLGQFTSAFKREIVAEPGAVYGLFTRWNFTGRLWFEGDQFHMEIWRFHARIEVLSAPTLPALKAAACEKYGYD